jgi:YidC/Oxa1 family membrane protein insertase
LTAHHILSSSAIEKTSCNQVAAHSAKFLFIPDITHQATGAVLIVLMALYVGSQLGSTLLMSVTGPAGSRGVMMALPFLFVLFIFRFPAGLLVYWITTNLWTMGQQYFVRRRIGPAPLAAPAIAIDGPSTSSSANGRPDGPGAGSAPPVLAGAGGAGSVPSAPRRKKKRSGRRR